MIQQVLADGSGVEVSEEAYESLAGAAMRIVPEQMTVLRAADFVALRLDAGHGCVMEVVFSAEDAKNVGAEMAVPRLVVADRVPPSAA